MIGKEEKGRGEKRGRKEKENKKRHCRSGQCLEKVEVFYLGSIALIFCV